MDAAWLDVAGVGAAAGGFVGGLIAILRASGPKQDAAKQLERFVKQLAGQDYDATPKGKGAQDPGIIRTTFEAVVAPIAEEQKRQAAEQARQGQELRETKELVELLVDSDARTHTRLAEHSGENEAIKAELEAIKATTGQHATLTDEEAAE